MAYQIQYISNMDTTVTEKYSYARGLIEANVNPVIVIDTDSVIRDMNQVFSIAVAKKPEQILGTLCHLYFSDPEDVKAACKRIFEDGSISDYELTITDHREKDFLFDGYVYKNELDVILGAVLVARDISKQKKTERELTIAKKKAEKSAKIAEDAVKSKQQFLSNMSHEIRTPMNAIIGFTKVILRTDLTAKQKEYITAIKLSGDTLIVLINDILDLAKVDSGKMIFEKIPFKLSLAVSAMLHLFEEKVQEKNLLLVKKYDNNIPEVLLGDPVRLHQIILNLVSNAVKFTNKGKITVSILLQSEDDEKAVVAFSVTDTGIGIEKNKINKIFENFQQAHSVTSRMYGGTGLGLAIVKQLVHNQGGTIHVESIVDEGTTFSFVLEFKKTNRKVALENNSVALDTEIKKDISVLVVEDIILNQLLIKTLLDDFGFDCDIASNGIIALEKLKTETYDIILMDLQMPEMNGFDTTKYIRNKLKSDIPIIALTADVTTVDLEKCKASGMDDYIAKPIDERLLYNKIMHQLKKETTTTTNVDNATEKEVMETEEGKYIDLNYLKQLTECNPKLMEEMISVYLEQTPPIIDAMKQSLIDNDWQSLQEAVHKIIPSFSLMGIGYDIENIARRIQKYEYTLNISKEIQTQVLKLETICEEAFKELETELNNIKEIDS